MGGTRLVIETGQTQSCENSQKARRLPTAPCTSGERRPSPFRKETGVQSEYTAKWQTHKPYKVMEICGDHNPALHLGFRSG